MDFLKLWDQKAEPGNAGLPGDKGPGVKPPETPPVDPLAGLSPEQLRDHAQKLSKDLENERKIAKDHQAGFTKKSEEAALAAKKAENLESELKRTQAALNAYAGQPPSPKGPERKKVDYDAIIERYDRQIAKFEKEQIDCEDIKASRDLAINAKEAATELEKLKIGDAKSKEFAMAYTGVHKNPLTKDFDDWDGLAKFQAELEAQGEKISTPVALRAYMGSPEYLTKIVEKQVTERLEADKKAAGARGHEGGEYVEPTPEEKAEEEAMREYSKSLNAPAGLEIQ